LVGAVLNDLLAAFILVLDDVGDLAHFLYGLSRVSVPQLAAERIEKHSQLVEVAMAAEAFLHGPELIKLACDCREPSSHLSVLVCNNPLFLGLLLLQPLHCGPEPLGVPSPDFFIDSSLLAEAAHPCLVGFLVKGATESLVAKEEDPRRELLEFHADRSLTPAASG